MAVCAQPKKFKHPNLRSQHRRRIVGGIEIGCGRGRSAHCVDDVVGPRNQPGQNRQLADIRDHQIRTVELLRGKSARGRPSENRYSVTVIDQSPVIAAPRNPAPSTRIRFCIATVRPFVGRLTGIVRESVRGRPSPVVNLSPFASWFDRSMTEMTTHSLESAERHAENEY